MFLLFTETIRLIRDGEPRTATSIFAQLLSSKLERPLSSKLLYQTNRQKQKTKQKSINTKMVLFTLFDL